MSACIGGGTRIRDHDDEHKKAALYVHNSGVFGCIGQLLLTALAVMFTKVCKLVTLTDDASSMYLLRLDTLVRHTYRFVVAT